MIAIGIIGVLSAVAIPAYQGYQSNAAENAAKAEITTMARSVTGCLALSGNIGSCDEGTEAKLPSACKTGTTVGTPLVHTTALTAPGCSIGANAAANPTTVIIHSFKEGGGTKVNACASISSSSVDRRWSKPGTGTCGTHANCTGTTQTLCVAQKQGSGQSAPACVWTTTLVDANCTTGAKF